MEYRIDCPCGEHITVRETAAGMTFTCKCGQPIKVPARSHLRSLAGLHVSDASPDYILPGLLASGQLPTGDTCSYCGNSTSEIRYAHVECAKRAHIDGAILLTNVLKGFVIIVAWLSMFVFSPIWFLIIARREAAADYPDDPIFDLPFLVCGLCQPALKDSEIVKRCLRKEPEYQRLLDRFPASKISLIG